MTYTPPNIVNYRNDDFDNWLSKLDNTIFDLYPEYAMFTIDEAYTVSLNDYIKDPLKGFIDVIEGEYIFESMDSYDKLMNSLLMDSQFDYSEGQGTIDIDYSDTIRGENTDFVNQCKPGSLISLSSYSSDNELVKPFSVGRFVGIVDSIVNENTLKLRYFGIGQLTSKTLPWQKRENKFATIQKKQKYLIAKEIQLYQYILIAYNLTSSK